MSDSFPVLREAWDGNTYPDVAGEQTAPFTPAWTEPMQAVNGRHAAPADDPCRCGLCPQPDPDCKDALLSCAPGVVARMHSERVRNGQWTDIPAYGREAGLRVSKPAVDNLARIHANAEHGRLDIDLLIDRTPDLHHHHWALRAGLLLAERVLTAQLTAWQPGEPPRTIAEMGAAVDITAAITAERMLAS